MACQWREGVLQNRSKSKSESERVCGEDTEHSKSESKSESENKSESESTAKTPSTALGKGAALSTGAECLLLSAGALRLAHPHVSFTLTNLSSNAPVTSQ